MFGDLSPQKEAIGEGLAEAASSGHPPAEASLDVELPDLVSLSPDLVEFVWNLVTKLTEYGRSTSM